MTSVHRLTVYRAWVWAHSLAVVGLAFIAYVLAELLPRRLVWLLPSGSSSLIFTIAAVQAAFLIVRYRLAAFWWIWVAACVGLAVLQDLLVTPFANSVMSYPYLLGRTFAVCGDVRPGGAACIPMFYLVNFVPTALAMGAVQWLLLRRAARRAALLTVGQVLGMVAQAAVVAGTIPLWGSTFQGGILGLCVAMTVYAYIVGLAVLMVKPGDRAPRA